MWSLPTHRLGTTELENKSSAFNGTWMFIMCSQEDAIGSYPEPDKSNPLSQNLLP
jgi:hypothetical protein